MSMQSCGLYEIEYQRMFNKQGEVLKKVTFLQKQLNCYINKQIELRQLGTKLKPIEQRIQKTQQRLSKYTKMRDIIEDYKHEISINNPLNADRALDERIIENAYNAAYEQHLVRIERQTQR